ncbi:cytidylyltransferase domain-containing protein, partial [Hymenobacter agri]
LPLYLATTTEPADDALAAYAAARGLPYHRGSETDVLARYYETGVKFGLDVIVRVTSDCPLVDGRLIGEAVARYQADADPLEFRSNSIIRSFPRGLDFEIFSMPMLAEACERATSPFEREHVTPYLKTGPAATHFRNVDEVWPGGDFGRFRITLDTPEDYEVLRRLIEEHHANQLALPALLALLEAQPEIMALNAGVEQKTI